LHRRDIDLVNLTTRLERQLTEAIDNTPNFGKTQVRGGRTHSLFPAPQAASINRP
jgi:hypothetical protein